jgi:hypothetical protein
MELWANVCFWQAYSEGSLAVRRRRDGHGPGHRPKSLSLNTACSGGPWQPSRRAGGRAVCDRLTIPAARPGVNTTAPRSPR